MQKRLLILNIIASSLWVLAWILAVAAVALEEWTNTTGETATTSTSFGTLQVTQTSGIYQTVVKKCCQLNGQSVPDMGDIVCDTSVDPCDSIHFRTATYCNYRDTELGQVNIGGGEENSFSCAKIQAGSVITVLLTLIVLIASLVLVGLFGAKRISLGSFAAGLVPVVFSSLLSIIMYKVLAHDEISTWMADRYSVNQNSAYPFTTTLGDSFSLLVSSFVFQVLALVAAVLRWLLRPKTVKPASQIVPRNIIYSDPYELESEPDITTPHRIHVNRNAADGAASSPVVSGGMSPAALSRAMSSNVMPTTKRFQSLLLCPQDKVCAFADNFSHQLEYAHTCRDFYCCDSSAAHRQHWYHPNSKNNNNGGGGEQPPLSQTRSDRSLGGGVVAPTSRATFISNPSIHNPVHNFYSSPNSTTTSVIGSSNNRSMGTLDSTIPAAEGSGGGGGLKRTPTWLRPTQPTPGTMEEAQAQNQIYRSQSNVGRRRY